jgi:nitroimidazol reductase NimA-like FMN-containing flavoprotein (pyridoxamine 5'-phosphate oxidase superfamily)
MLGKLTGEEIEKLLKENFVGHLGCHADGLTYVVPISYAYEDGCVWGRTFEGMKMDIIRRNPSVCFQVETIPGMSNWRSVIGWGEFDELTKHEEKNKAMKILLERKSPSVSSIMAKLSADWPFCDINCDNITGIFFKIALIEKTGRFEINQANYAFVM